MGVPFQNKVRPWLDKATLEKRGRTNQFGGMTKDAMPNGTGQKHASHWSFYTVWLAVPR